MAKTRATAKTDAASFSAGTGQTLAVAAVDAYLAIVEMGEATYAKYPALVAFVTAMHTAHGDHIK